MGCLLQGLTLVEGVSCPCLLMVAWAWCKSLNYYQHLEVDPGTGITTMWSIPRFASTSMFYPPGRDFLTTFMAFLDKTDVIVRPTHQSSPSVLAVLKWGCS